MVLKTFQDDLFGLIQEVFNPKENGIFIVECDCSCCMHKVNMREEEQEQLLQRLLSWLEEKQCRSKWIVNVFRDSVRFIPVCEMKNSIFHKEIDDKRNGFCLKFFE